MFWQHKTARAVYVDPETAHAQAVRAEIMNPRSRRGRHRRGGWSMVALAVLLGVRLVQGDPYADPPQPTAAAAVGAAPGKSGSQDGAKGSRPSRFGEIAPGAHAPMSPSRPARLAIPSIGVNAPFLDIGYDAQGQIDAPPPERADTAGWFASGPTPGEQGTAVISGHVDTRRGPAVFYSLGALPKGSTVEIARDDGKTAVFTVYGVEVVPRDDFPAERVYADTGTPELRLMTCGGTFTGGQGYDANVIAFAKLTDVR
ncbi:class F sortase [Streptomyces sp. NPDC091292]|uniref:class F sortase n=1 Tax=Streptomyces sp. NPDC091292 TaxID=3365991 RepID=UPI003800DDFC